MADWVCPYLMKALEDDAKLELLNDLGLLTDDHQTPTIEPSEPIAGPSQGRKRRRSSHISSVDLDNNNDEHPETSSATPTHVQKKLRRS